MSNPPRRISRPRHRSISLGALPVAAINKALGTELEPTNVRLSATAHRHIAEDHARDYAACIAALPEAVAAPTFAGQAPNHTRHVEIVRRVPRADRRSVLVAIGLEMDDAGEFRVRSCYLVEPEKIDARRANGTLKQIPPQMTKGPAYAEPSSPDPLANTDLLVLPTVLFRAPHRPD